MKTLLLQKISIFTLLFSAALSACGGGATIAEGGMSGTGITMGRITGFGSVIVNGIRFDVSRSSFTRDGLEANGQNEFKIGEVVTILGNINPDGVTGVANSVEFADILEGPVTLPSSSTTLEVFGQQVETDNLTQFYNFTELNDLQKGNIVEISGFVTADGIIHATSINLKSGSFEAGSIIEMKGVISYVDRTVELLTINNLVVDYGNALLKNVTKDQLTAGLMIEVYTDGDIQSNTIIATEIEVEDEQEYASGTEIELEGLITRFTSINDFAVNGQAIKTTATTKYEDGSSADLSLNVLVEIEGVINDQDVLIATKVSIEDRDGGDQGDDDK